MLKLRSLRFRILAVVCVVVAAPVFFVWMSSPFEDAIGLGMRVSLERAANRAVELVHVGATRSELQEVADDFGAWIRVLDAEGQVTTSVDGIHEPSIRERLQFAPEPVPDIREYDARLAPLDERTGVDEAFRTGRSGSCGYAADARLLVCELARRVDLDGATEPRIVHLLIAQPRGLSTLYDERYQVLELTGFVLFVALALGLWLAWRMGRPLKVLREQVLARTEPPGSTTPIDMERGDEFGELASAFNELLGALEERRRSNEAFMADMAHEIKNPVAAIRAAAESLARGEDVPAARAERISRILFDSSRRLDGFVTQFLELARAEAGLPRAERDHVRVDELVRNMMKPYGADERFEHLTFDVEARRAQIDGSADHVERAIRNLVENAASFAGSRVIVRVTPDRHEVVIAVIDDGPGIPPEDIARVFDRFFTRRDDGGGTGLGLAMARAVVEAHGGSIEVDSAPGEGTTFRIRLPAANA